MRIKGIIIAIVIVLVLASCGPFTETTYVEGIMVDGVFYEKSASPSPGEVDKSAIIGYTTSYSETTPKKDGETNFDKALGSPYARVADGIAVLYEHEWYICKTSK